MARYKTRSTRTAAPDAYTAHVWRHSFESVGAYMDARPAPGRNARVWQATESPAGSTWAFGSARDAHGVAARVTNGWADGARRVTESFAALDVPVPESVKRAIVRGDFGDEFDPHAAYRGDFAHAWTRRPRRARRAPRTIKLVAHIARVCADSESAYFWNGAAIVRLSDLLTQAGYGVEIEAVFVGLCAADTAAAPGADNPSVRMAVPIKAAQAPLDVALLAGVLCQPGMQRHYGFKALCSAPFAVSGNMCRYGDKHAALDAVAADSAPDTYVIPYACATKDAAAAWILSTLETIGKGQQ